MVNIEKEISYLSKQMIDKLNSTELNLEKLTNMLTGDKNNQNIVELTIKETAKQIVDDYKKTVSEETFNSLAKFYKSFKQKNYESFKSKTSRGNYAYTVNLCELELCKATIAQAKIEKPLQTTYSTDNKPTMTYEEFKNDKNKFKKLEKEYKKICKIEKIAKRNPEKAKQMFEELISEQ